MRHWMACTLTALCLLSCAGCGTQLADAPLPLDELPSNYSLAQAKKDDCVVFEDLRMTSGQNLWDSFVEASSQGKAAHVRLCRYYTLDEDSCAPSHFAEIKDEYPNEYPAMFLQDLQYDGEQYTIRSYEDGQELVRTYPYMLRYAGRGEHGASFSSYIIYVLTQDDSVTWEEIVAGDLSSQWGQAIDHYVVYEELR